MRDRISKQGLFKIFSLKKKQLEHRGISIDYIRRYEDLNDVFICRFTTYQDKVKFLVLAEEEMESLEKWKDSTTYFSKDECVEYTVFKAKGLWLWVLDPVWKEL